MTTPTTRDFQMELARMLRTAQHDGLAFLDVKAGDLHRQVGGYPQPNHRMPVCCDVMRQNMGPSDFVLRQPPKGKGATLEIRYIFPR